MEQGQLVNILAWLLIVLGGALVSSLVWFAMRIVAQLDKLESLFSHTIGEHNVRITRLEDWRSLTQNSAHGPHTSRTE